VSELPPGWAEVHLGDLIEPTRDAVSPRSCPSLPYLGLEHVEAESTRILGTASSSVVRSTAYRFERGATLYARLRPYLNKVCTPDFNGIGSGEFIVFPPSPNLAAGFLKYLLNQPRFVSFASTLDTGDRPRVSWSGIAQFTFGLPPRPEQDRIVAAIEEQFSRIDVGNRALGRGRRTLKRMRTAILQWVVSVKPGRPFHRVRFGDLLSEQLRNGHSSKRDDSGEIPILRLSAVTSGDFSPRNIKMTSAHPERVRDLWLRSGDLLIERSNTRDLVGTARLYTGPDHLAVFPDLIIRARVGSGILPRYAELVLQSPQSRRYFQGRAQGISGSMPKIDQAVIESLAVPLPPLSVQAEIVSRADQAFSVLSAIENSLATVVGRIMNLRSSVLRAAFSGQLVPQDLRDEPTSVLLERIQADRASQNGDRPTRVRMKRRVKVSA
jgi:type I restriction enzyme, S subunit